MSLNQLPSPLRAKWESVRKDTFPARPSKALTTDDELKAIQRAMDAYKDKRYIPDVGDNWMRPKDFTIRSGGDCEDFAIARIAYLWLSGFKENQLALCIGTQKPRTTHAVCWVKCSNGVNYMLDNLHDHAYEERLHERWFSPILYICRNEWWTP